MQKSSKEQEHLRRQCNSLLNNFERLRQWADFSNWLHKLLQLLTPRRCNQLPHQLNLCKRLAQCLNPSLPAGVHATALRVYQTILHNVDKKTELLPLTAMGLLPFFEHSNTQNKHSVLKILEEHFLSQIQGMQMIVALMNALLTVFNQNSQELAKRVYGICEKIGKNYGKMWVDGAVWVNILKSPKVRLAGFKFFTKVFKDRDRAAQNQKEKDNQELDRIGWQKIEKKIEQSKLGEEEKVLLVSLYTNKSKPDTYLTRFPNFSSLVVNALCACLEVNADNMIKRAALDLLAGHLKLSNGVFGRREGVIIMQKILLLLQGKEYSLTNRVYKYLFDQPNSQGIFSIDLEKKEYQLDIMKEALGNLLTPDEGHETEGVLLIMEILIGDHPTLAEFLLSNLAMEIIFFAQKQQDKHKKQKMLIKSVGDFYLNVILLYRKCFISSLLKNIPKMKQEEHKSGIFFSGNDSLNSLLTSLHFYFSRMEIILGQPRRKDSRDGDVSEVQKMDETKEKIQYLTIRVQTLTELIEQLWLKRPLEEQTSIRILDLCNELLAEIQIRFEYKQQGLSPELLQKVTILLSDEANLKRKSIFAKLITLHPNPKKQILLPYIQDSQLSIVCINLLLGGDRVNSQSVRPRVFSSGGKSVYRSDTKKSISLSDISGQPLQLTEQEQDKVFFAIFKLLNCHLFQARALEFIERYKHWWGFTFDKLINQVEPSEWLLYWKKMEGQVAGGILRMVENLNSQNSFYRHLSRKWISQAENIISKVLDTVFRLLNRERRGSIHEQLGQFNPANVDAYQRIFNLIQLIFRSTSKGFSKFFFIQKDKYLAPFILYTFKCLDSEEIQIKSKALSMLSFLLNQAETTQQKLDFLKLTLPNILAILDRLIDRRIQDRQKEVNLQDQIVFNNNFEIEILEYVSLSIKRVEQIQMGDDRTKEVIIGCMKSSGIYEVLLKGITFTEVHYIKKLYIELSKQFSEMLARVDKGKTQITSFITRILDKLFFLLKTTDVNRVQQMIKNRNQQLPKQIQGRRKNSSDVSEVFISFSKQTVLETEVLQNLNLEEKYAEIIQLWNTVKYYLQFAVRVQLRQMPIINLLSLMLSSFPLSDLRYAAIGSPIHTATLQNLEEEASQVTGLKKQVFAIFQILWNKQSRQIVDFLVQKSDPRILIHSRLDPSKVLQVFNKCLKMKEATRYIKSEKFNLPKNMLHFNTDQLLRENQLLFFLYGNLLYCDLRLLKNKRINVFLQSIIDFMDAFRSSHHVQTKLWLLQIMQLIGQRVISPKELNIEHGNRIRSDLHKITKELIDDLVSIITRSKNFTHKVEMKTGIFGLFNKEQKQNSLYEFVRIFPPTIFQNYERYRVTAKKAQEIRIKSQIYQKQLEDEKKVDVEHPRVRLKGYLMNLENKIYDQSNQLDNFLFNRFAKITQPDFIQFSSFVALKTLIRIGNSMLINVFQKDLGKISLIVKEIVLNILPICENREPDNQFANQLVAQYLHSILAHQQLRFQILRILRKNIIQIYMNNGFFKCTQRTLAHWRTVIDYCIGQNNQLLAELLSKQGLFDGIFNRKTQAIKTKVKSLQRVCFIIYSGRVDRYQNKLRTVLQSLNEVMKQEDASPPLLILILFCIRILLMRLSAISLNKLFKSVWPSLITLLIQVFKKGKGPKPSALLLAALKVVELLHAMKLQQFMLHRWMFVFDYFGLKVEPMGQIEDNMPHCQMHTPFLFKPYFCSTLPTNRLRCKFQHEASESPENKRVRRRLIVTKCYSESEEQVKEYALLLMQYMMDLNECRTEIPKGQIESLIQEEFVSLDDFILKVK